MLRCSCFGLFTNRRGCLFWARKLMERWYILVTEKLFWTFWRWKMWSFFRARKLMERLYVLITEKFLFGSFSRWEIRSFLSQNVNEKMIFTCCFWASHVILGLKKYGFSCRAEASFLQLLIKIFQWGIPYLSIHSSTYVITCARFVTKQV